MSIFRKLLTKWWKSQDQALSPDPIDEDISSHYEPVRISIRPVIRALTLGEHADFPMDHCDSARTAAHELGKKLKRKYKVKTIDRDTYRVTYDKDLNNELQSSTSNNP